MNIMKKSADSDILTDRVNLEMLQWHPTIASEVEYLCLDSMNPVFAHGSSGKNFQASST